MMMMIMILTFSGMDDIAILIDHDNDSPVYIKSVQFISSQLQSNLV